MSLTFRCGGGMIYNEDKKGADKMLQKILETTPYEQCTTPENFTKFKIVETNFNNISNRYERIPEEKVIIEGTDYPANIETTFKLFHNIIVRNTKGDLYELMYNTKEVTKETKIWTGEIVKSVHTCIEYQVYRRVRKKTVDEIGESDRTEKIKQNINFVPERRRKKIPVEQVFLFGITFFEMLVFGILVAGALRNNLINYFSYSTIKATIFAITVTFAGPILNYIYILKTNRQHSSKIILHKLIYVNAAWWGIISFIIGRFAAAR